VAFCCSSLSISSTRSGPFDRDFPGLDPSARLALKVFQWDLHSGSGVIYKVNKLGNNFLNRLAFQKMLLKAK
jgi:hypothetical protein